MKMKKILLSALMVMGTACFAKPTVTVLATGGTIAGVSSSHVSSTYKAGSMTAEQLIASVPELDNIATIKYEQVYNKDSGNVTLSDWLKLADYVKKASDDSTVNAIVITHGTDTLEETAFFLNLVVKTDKPIVLVGAMRAATSLSADGPLNLYNAVSVAINPDSVGRGVLVAMNEHIFDARNVTKTNTSNVDTFQSPNLGPIGDVFMGDVKYNAKTIKPHTKDTPFNVKIDSVLPKVLVIYEHGGMDTTMLNNILSDKDIKGIVMAGVGDGNIPDYAGDFLKQARKQGIIIARSSRVGSGFVSYDYNNLDTTFDLVTANDLNPEKARILLMLSLMNTGDVKEIQKLFYKY